MPAQIFQIFYNEPTRQILDPGFTPYNNLENPRPDWAEFWIIRNYLLHNEIKNDEWLGFFSPKFGIKSGNSSAQVFSFIDAAPSNADVIHFAPFWEQGCYFMNVFEQGNYWHPGFDKAAEAFFRAIGFSKNVNHLVMGKTSSVFCNYFVAKPKFWARWMQVAEKLFQFCEDESNPLQPILRAQTVHNTLENYSFKVFIQERIVSFLLVTESWTSFSPPISNLKIQLPFLQPFERQLIACDALKAQYIQTGDNSYLDEFFALRNDINRTASKK